MGIGDDFSSFCSRLHIAKETRSSISTRYAQITKRLNTDFWHSDSSTANSFYAGSYGRGTAIRGISDLDMVFVLPYPYYVRYNAHSGNGQSAMLQDVRTALQKTYPTSRIGGDGQVVVVSFTDGITFEIVPAFSNNNGSYTYPDSNGGGRWLVTNPKPEIASVAALDKTCSGNLKQLCRMARAWKNVWDVPMGGLLIDTLSARFLSDWNYKDKSFLYYDWMSRDFFSSLSQEPTRDHWLALGSGQYIYSRGDFQYKAKRCYNIALEAIEHESRGELWSAHQKWRRVYGTSFPE